MNKKTRRLILAFTLLTVGFSTYFTFYGVIIGTEDHILKQIFHSLFLLSLFLYIHIIGHELGHLVAGLISGYEFLLFRIGKYSIYKNHQGIKFGFYELPGTLGQAIMAPGPHMDKDNFPYILYNYGGVGFNILSSIVAMIFCYNLSTGRFYTSISYSIMGLYLAVTNLVSVPGVPNDGEHVRNMNKSRTVRHNFYRLLKDASDNINGKITGRTYSSIQLDDPEFLNYPINQNILTNEITYSIYTKDYDKSKELINYSLKDQRVQGLFRTMILSEDLYLAILQGNDDRIEHILSDPTFKKFLDNKSLINNLRISATYYRYIEDIENYNKKISLFNKMKDTYPFKGDIILNKTLLDRDRY